MDRKVNGKGNGKLLVGQAAVILGLSRDRARSLADLGELGPVERAGGVRLLDRAHVEACAARRAAKKAAAL